MPELEMWRILFNNNPNPEPETQDLLVKKHNTDLECIVAKRRKTQGWWPEERDEKSDRPDTPRAVLNGHM